MPAQHHYLLKSKYLPHDLFAALKECCELPQFKAAGTSFEFDWIKRRVALVAPTAAMAEDVLEQLILRVNKGAGPGMLLPGAAVSTESGSTMIPIGVLLQTPDIYVEILVATLHEFGVRGVVLTHDGDGFAIPLSRVNRALSYADALAGFPLPPYLELVDEGISE